jgi:hypothetical protein
MTEPRRREVCLVFRAAPVADSAEVEGIWLRAQLDRQWLPLATCWYLDPSAAEAPPAMIGFTFVPDLDLVVDIRDVAAALRRLQAALAAETAARQALQDELAQLRAATRPPDTGEVAE